MKFDDILSKLGEFGLYQKRLYFMLCLPAIFIGIETMLQMVFLFAVPKHRCAIPGLNNDTYEIQNEDHARFINIFIPETIKHGEIQYSECEVYSNISYGSETVGITTNTTGPCSSWVYDKTVYDTTLAQELDMVCEKKLFVTHAKMLVMIGQFIGVFTGPISDMFGRKKVILASLCSHTAFSFALAWVPNYIVLCVVIVSVQTSGMSLYMAAYVFGMELVGPSKRMWTGIVMTLFWSAGNLTLALVAFLLREWHIRQIILSAPPMLLFFYICVLPESPRWLLMKNRKKEAETVILRAAKVNRVTILPDILEHVEHDKVPDEKFWKLFRSKILFVRSLIIYFNWFAVSAAFYGLSIHVTSLYGNVYFNFFMFAVFEALAYALDLLLIDRIGRKKLVCAAMLLSGVACCMTLFPVLFADKTHGWIVTVLATIGNTGASAAFAVIFVFSSELFPTVSRSSGLSACSISGRIGGIIAPYIADLGLVFGGTFGRILPIVIFGVVSCVAGVMSLLLPETLHQKLPDTVKDAELLGKNNLHSTERELEVLRGNENFA